MLNRVHFVDVLETLLILDRSELRNVQRPAALRLKAKHIGSGHEIDEAREQVGPLCKGASQRDATG